MFIEVDVVGASPPLPISGAAAFNAPTPGPVSSMDDEDAAGGALAMIPLGSGTTVIGAGATSDPATLAFTPHPREPITAASPSSSRLRGELPFPTVRFMLSLESNNHPRDPMVATTSITSIP